MRITLYDIIGPRHQKSRAVTLEIFIMFTNYQQKENSNFNIHKASYTKQNYKF